MPETLKYKQTKIGLIPEDWELNKLSEIGFFYKGKGISKSEIIEDGVKAVRYGELYTKYQIRTNKVLSCISVESSLSSYQGEEGDVLFPGSGETADEIGKPSMLDEAAFIGGDIIGFKPENVNSLFLAYAVNMPYSFRFRESRGQGNSVVHIYKKDLEQHPVILPPLAEQQKIAEILSTWDACIIELDQLIAAKKQLKKGLMQQLLTGQKRFPEFIPQGGTQYKQTKLGLVPEDWEVVKFQEITNINMGQSPKGDSYNNHGVGTPLINGPTEFTDRYPVKKQWTTKPTKICMKGDVLICVRGSSTGRINISNDSYCIGRGVAAIRANSENDLAFVEFVLREKVNEVLRLTTGSTFPSVDRKTLSEFVICLPPLPEQQKMAATLSAIDEEIQELSTQKTAYQTQKKGLMQVLLTGKVRVKVEIE